MANDGDGDPKKLLIPHFSGQINLGHILQMVVIVFTVGGTMFGTYFAITDRVSAQSNNISLLQSQVLELSKHQQQADDERRQLSKEMSNTLVRLNDQLVDLRVLVASIRDGVHK